MAGLIKQLLVNTKSFTLSYNLRNPNVRLLVHRKHKYALPTICSFFHTSSISLKKRKTAEEKKSPRMIQYAPKAKGEIVDVWRNIRVFELAQVLDKDINYVYDLFLGNVKGRNTPIADIKELHNAIRRSGKRMKIIAKPEEEGVNEEIKDVFRRPPPAKADLKPRPPIVTIMGHVDHGKTTLLDALRHSSVVEQEFGGITQHIGAFSVKLESGATVTFLDTPGHAAFSAMRARGADVTDIVVLVVAADDGVMEQTVECIRMANQAKVPLLVAINKIDAPKANIERTQQMLLQKGIQVEQLGGDVQAVCISALKKKNLNQLTEALVLQAELMEIGGDPSGLVEAVVIESRLDPQKGCLCTLVVQRGTLRKGDILVADNAMAKVRLIRNSQGQILNEVPPGFPAEVEGWRDLPSAGELILEVETEKQAKSVIKFREEKKIMKKVEEDAPLIAAKEEEHLKEYKEKLKLRRRLGWFKLRREGPRKPEISPNDDKVALKMVLKADVDGTLEAILEALSTYHSTECDMQIVNYGVGPVTETDVELAKTFNGIIYAFNVECPSAPKQKAQDEEVAIKHFNVIYNLIDTIKEDINSKLPLKEIEEIIGEATVLQLFLINEGRKKVPIAGCMCTKGNLKRKASYRVMRNDATIYEGTLTSMRYIKNEVDLIKTNSECGLQIADKSILFEPNDLIICYETKMESQTIDWNPGF